MVQEVRALEYKVVCIKLRSLNDLARLASSIAMLGHSTHILHFRTEKSHVYGLLVVLRDFYKYYGLPVFYYIELVEKLKGNYVLVKVDENGERVEVSEGTRHGWIGVPIVSLAEPPPFINMYVKWA